ncbi:MAG: hypothetical protein H3Z50_03290 [archaeon]|nr:hypothetical protein [archaeon]MCP8306882.1 hypothetical protein [archaeon]
MGSLKRHDLEVQAFKVSLDYIDPSHHTAILGRPSRNLDAWLEHILFLHTFISLTNKIGEEFFKSL